MTASDLYLVIATIAVVLFTICGIAVLVYLLLILHRVHTMLDGIDDFFQHWKMTTREFFLRAQGLKATADMIGDGLRTLLQLYQKSAPGKRRSQKQKNTETLKHGSTESV